MFADYYKEWAWGEGKGNFPDSLFDDSEPPEIYLKYKVSKYFETITPSSIDLISDKSKKAELELLKAIQPHSIITTNYDRFLELLFKDYEPIIGQRILHTDYSSVGEIFKIHGCSSEPSTLVLTRKDYNNFLTKKKYLSAKLLTFFAEHPLLFIGYNAEDPNIKNILADIDEIISSGNELIPNIYILEWKPNLSGNENPQREKVISVDTNRSIRVKSIIAASFDWVFKAFGKKSVLENVNPKLLRALMARTYQLVRCDIPTNSIQVDYKTLEQAVNTYDGLAKIFGITTLNNPSAFNIAYPYTLTAVANKLGFNNCNAAHQLISKINEEKGKNIKTSDNKYHSAIKNGNTIQIHKYSEAAVELLVKVRDGVPYNVDI